MYRKNHKSICILMLITAVVFFLSAGCGKVATPPSPSQPLEDEKEGIKEPSPPGKDGKEEITLFFVSEDTNSLTPEVREIEPGGRDLKLVALEELIQGPKNPALGRTIPPEAKVLGITVEKNSLAVVNFSREIVTAHWGGSMGEIMTVYSVVNTLALFPDIEQVKFLVEGEEVETLTGHLDISGPIEPDWGLVEE